MAQCSRTLCASLSQCVEPPEGVSRNCRSRDPEPQRCQICRHEDERQTEDSKITSQASTSRTSRTLRSQLSGSERIVAAVCGLPAELN